MCWNAIICHPCVLYVLLTSVNGLYTDLTVNTRDGPVLGYSLNLSHHLSVPGRVDGVNIFLGIPYAEPPVGNLRFARPVPKKSWAPNVLSAKVMPPICPQILSPIRSWSLGSDFNNSSEDCLYLNIYAPTSTQSPNQQYPVMVWIHGGAYRYGSGIEYDGRILAQEGVVVVSINYRLGILGFLSTDDDVAPGNYALLDQALAIKWTKNNIKNFGGDPNKLTIFGQSAGGGSVSLQMFSPLTKGLFQAVIPQSGCALSPWAIYRPPHNISTYTKMLAQKLGCFHSSSISLITCLRRKSVDEIIGTSIRGPPMIATWAPRVDGYFITDLPEVLLDQGNYHKNVTVMTGYVPQELSEDLGTVPGIAHGLTKHQMKQTFFDKSRRYLTKADDMLAALLCVYPPSNQESVKNREMVIAMNSDYGYVAPHIKMAEKLSADGVRVWLYDFTYRSTNSIHPEWVGVPHAEELYYQFGSPFFSNTPCPGPTAETCPSSWENYQLWSQTDRDVSQLTMALWTGFAKQSSQSNVIHLHQPTLHWPRFRAGGFLLNISDTVYTNSLIKTRGIQFWDTFNYLNLSVPVPNLCNPSIVG